MMGWNNDTNLSICSLLFKWLIHFFLKKKYRILKI